MQLFTNLVVPRQSSLSVEVGRVLERCQKEARAVDTESLCIIAGQKVWLVGVEGVTSC